MTTEAPSLGDFFKSKSKKKVKASNLNKETTTKTEETKKKTKATEDDAWEEERVEASTMKVEVAGKLMREEEKKDDEDTAAPAWGNLKKDSSANQQINEKRFPTLAKSVQSSSINIDDGSDAKVNIQTSKNHFAALEGNEDSDEEGGAKRPKEIKPAMVSKKKGEFAKVALQREVDKYSIKKDTKKKAKKENEEDEEDDDEEEEAEAEEAEEPAPVAEEEGRKKKSSEKKEEKKDDKKAAKKPVPEQDDSGEVAEDLKIQVDLVASKEKYKGRKKLPPADLPREELEQQDKENKRVQPTAGGKKKKMFVEEDTDKKLSYADW